MTWYPCCNLCQCWVMLCRWKQKRYDLMVNSFAKVLAASCLLTECCVGLFRFWKVDTIVVRQKRYDFQSLSNSYAASGNVLLCCPGLALRSFFWISKRLDKSTKVRFCFFQVFGVFVFSLFLHHFVAFSVSTRLYQINHGNNDTICSSSSNYWTQEMIG